MCIVDILRRWFYSRKCSSSGDALADGPQMVGLSMSKRMSIFGNNTRLQGNSSHMKETVKQLNYLAKGTLATLKHNLIERHFVKSRPIHTEHAVNSINREHEHNQDKFQTPRSQRGSVVYKTTFCRAAGRSNWWIDIR